MNKNKLMKNYLNSRIWPSESPDINISKPAERLHVDIFADGDE